MACRYSGSRPRPTKRPAKPLRLTGHIPGARRAHSVTVLRACRTRVSRQPRRCSAADCPRTPQPRRQPPGSSRIALPRRPGCRSFKRRRRRDFRQKALPQRHNPPQVSQVRLPDRATRLPRSGWPPRPFLPLGRRRASPGQCPCPVSHSRWRRAHPASHAFCHLLPAGLRSRVPKLPQNNAGERPLPPSHSNLPSLSRPACDPLSHS